MRLANFTSDEKILMSNFPKLWYIANKNDKGEYEGDGHCYNSGSMIKYDHSDCVIAYYTRMRWYAVHSMPTSISVILT